MFAGNLVKDPASNLPLLYKESMSKRENLQDFLVTLTGLENGGAADPEAKKRKIENVPQYEPDSDSELEHDDSEKSLKGSKLAKELQELKELEELMEIHELDDTEEPHDSEINENEIKHENETPKDSQTESDDAKSFGLAKINKYEHCVRNLQNAIRTIVQEVPDFEAFQKASANMELDEFTRIGLKQSKLLKIACNLKTRYSNGEIPIFDDVLKDAPKIVLNPMAETSVNQEESLGLSNTDPLLDLKDLETLHKRNPRGPILENSKFELPPLPIIKNKLLRKRVFVHKSLTSNKTYLDDREIVGNHYERLEFLGDSVLHYLTTVLLYSRLPSAKEGFLSKWRSNIVCNKNLAKYSTQYHLDSMVRSNLDRTKLIPARQKLLADIFEAYVGALAVDRRYRLADIKDWLAKVVEAEVMVAENEIKKTVPINKDAKTQLYSLIGSALMHPIYRVVEGPATNVELYVVQCIMNNEVIGEGRAPNLKDAGLRAAMHALKATKKLELYIRMRLQTDRSVSIKKASSEDETGQADIQPQLKFPLIADSSIIGHKFAKNEIYAFFNQHMGVAPEYNTTFEKDENRYVARLSVKHVVFAIAYDNSKKNAEMRAATLILKNKNLLQDMMSAVI